MAEASSATAAVVEDLDDTSEMVLWSACAAGSNFNKLWFQSDLQGLDCLKSKNLHAILRCIHKLVDQCLFRSLETRDGKQCWKVVPETQAANIRKLNQEERMVYFELEQAGTEGLWTKVIKQRTHLQVAEITQALKKLESKALVKQFTSAKYPSKKLFILSHLQPSEEAAGGLFYSDGNLDAELLNHLMQWTEVYVHRKAWQARETASLESHGKRKRDDYEDPADASVLSGSKRWRGVKPMPSGYQGYATVGDVAKYLNKAGLLLKDKIMESEVDQVLNLLCYDGRLEKVPGCGGFRTVLRPIANPYQDVEEPSRNGFGEVPCGGCPALDLCDDTGPVNARTCEYFKEWL